MSKEMYCVILNCAISKYDCDEITCAAINNYLLNDGIPPMLDLDTIKKKRALCIECEHCDQKTKTRIKEQILNQSSSTPKMTKEVIKKRLTSRAAEYFMLKDD